MVQCRPMPLVLCVIFGHSFRWFLGRTMNQVFALVPHINNDLWSRWRECVRQQLPVCLQSSLNLPVAHSPPSGWRRMHKRRCQNKVRPTPSVSFVSLPTPSAKPDPAVVLYVKSSLSRWLRPRYVRNRDTATVLHIRSRLQLRLHLRWVRNHVPAIVAWLWLGSSVSRLRRLKCRRVAFTILCVACKCELGA